MTIDDRCYQLYYYPRNASLAPHFVLEQLGVDYRLVLVDRKIEAQKSADYLRLNPAGRIPTLVDGELVIFESAAICCYLGEQHPESKLVPSVNAPERAHFLQWLMYLTNTLQAELMVYFYPEKHTTDNSGVQAIVAAQIQRITACLALLDSALEERKFLIGESISVCDYFLLMLLLWTDGLPQPPFAFSHLAGYLRRLSLMPAVATVCEKEEINLTKYYR